MERLNSTDLLSDYAHISSRRKLAAETTALRLESEQYRQILAHQATSGSMTYAKLKESLLSDGDPSPQITEPVHLGSLGRVALLQQCSPADYRLGIKCLQIASELLPPNVKSRRFRQLLVEDAILTGRASEAEKLLDKYPDLDKEHFGYARAELMNPYKFASPEATPDLWLRNFNEPFIQNGLSPVNLLGNGTTAFDRLWSRKPNETSSPHGETPLVSVIITTHQPARAELLTSAMSILEQTWHNLELIIVDDASGEEFQEVLHEVTNLDDRVRVITCEVNGGTYRARNIGYEAAQGTFLTGQDDDDWSHPQRIQMQTETLLTNTRAPGCRVRAVLCTPDLGRVRRGYKPEGPNASSLMFRRQLFEEAGGFLPIRKAADTEFLRRIEVISSQPVIEINKPLSVVRIMDDSLSRSHFRAGWQHSSRRQFKSAYHYWHRNAEKSDLTLNEAAFPPVSIPRAIRAFPESFPTKLDAVFAGDWRQFGGPQKSMMEEIAALKNAGYAVGILHLEAPRFMSAATKPLCDPIQEMVNTGDVQEVLYDDPVDVDLLVLRYPPILQFSPVNRTGLRVGKLLVLANQAPSERDGSDIRYLVPDCNFNAQAMFGIRPLWVPQGPQVRDAIAPYLDESSLVSFDMPGIVNANNWNCDRSASRSLVPVVGRHSRDNVMKWPDSADTLRKLYPTNGKYDVRILGAASVPMEVLNLKSVPAGWTIYGTNEIPARQFLHSLDYYVFFQHPQSIEAFGRAILEAIATGLVVILPHDFHRVFGDGAIYRLPQDVESTIRSFHENPDLYKAQSDRALTAVREQFSHEAYQRLISQILHSSSEASVEAETPQVRNSRAISSFEPVR